MGMAEMEMIALLCVWKEANRFAYLRLWICGGRKDGDEGRRGR